MNRTALTAAAVAAGTAAGAGAGWIGRYEIARRRRDRRPSRPGLAVVLGDDAWVLGKLAATRHRMAPGDRITALTVLVDTADGEGVLYTASERSGPHKLVRTAVSDGGGTCERYVVMPDVPKDPSALGGTGWGE